MAINLKLPEQNSLKPIISIFGVGGAGGNAVNNMLSADLGGVNFVVANTDAQAMDESNCENRIQLGENITKGLGAGSYPEVGKAAAEESADVINDYLEGNNMVFITAGLGGGTGSGAAPVVAKLAREKGILTVAVVTKPFHFEGTHRMRIAELGLQELQKYVDTLIVIPNQNLFRIADKDTTFLDAFKLADDVLHSGVRGITDLMVMPGLINLDFADVRSVMSEMGKAMMGTGEAEGEARSISAAEAAIANPLLDNVSMQGANGVLINITGGEDMTLFEVDEAANRIREEVDPDANIIFGSAFDKNLNGKIRVSVVATGIDNEIRKNDDNNVSFVNFKNKNEAKEQSDEKKTTKENFNEDSFVMPEPHSPQEDSFQETAQNSTYREQSENKISPIQQKRGSGIFGSFFGKKEERDENYDELLETKEKPSVVNYNNNNISSDSKQLDIENNQQKSRQQDLNIPAYLRRKK